MPSNYTRWQLHLAQRNRAIHKLYPRVGPHILAISAVRHHLVRDTVRHWHWLRDDSYKFLKLLWQRQFVSNWFTCYVAKMFVSIRVVWQRYRKALRCGYGVRNYDMLSSIDLSEDQKLGDFKKFSGEYCKFHTDFVQSSTNLILSYSNLHVGLYFYFAAERIAGCFFRTRCKCIHTRPQHTFVLDFQYPSTFRTMTHFLWSFLL